MIQFRVIADDDPALPHSPLLRGALLTFDYIEENGPIGLTPSKALKRYFVHWAATAFEWPDYSAEDLFAVNKVLNEADFTPLMVLHDVLLGARLVRHHKGQLNVTKLGHSLHRRPGALWTKLTEHLLFVLDHTSYTRLGDRLVVDWDSILNFLNVEAHTGIAEDRFTAVLFGADREDYRPAAMAYIHILRPLCWAGLLSEHRHGEPFPSERLFMKTPLWPTVLALETDAALAPVVRH